jgi:hypothetical protein
MNVEIWTVAPQFFFWEYLFQIFLVLVLCSAIFSLASFFKFMNALHLYEAA